jgi:hypothetical protein
MKIALSIVLAGVMFSFTPVAKAVTIGFDELSTGQDVLNFYSGLGVFFSSGWIVSSPDVYLEPDGKSAEISGVGTLNAPLGLSGAFTSFYYSGGPLTVTFYDQEDGLGSVVASLNLAGQLDFTPAGDAFPIFKSVVFDSAAGNRIDAFNNNDFGLVVPEPGAVGLSLIGVAGLILARWRAH